MARRGMRGARIGLALGLAVAGLIVLGGLSVRQSALATTLTVSDVSAIDFEFVPPAITITTGSSVRWINNGGSHTSTGDTGLWDSGLLAAGGMFTRTFDTPGSYPYHCTFHQAFGMTGIVVVVPSTLTVCPSCPYTTIDAALQAAANGDLIRVASGAYSERLTITKTVTLEGGWNESFTTRAPGTSVIDAQRAGRVMTVLGPVSPTIDGFTITGGDATTEISGTHQGGGIYIDAGGALLVNNIITNNLATITTSTALSDRGYGGGVYAAGGSVVISASQILSNVAGAGGSNTEAYGGGVYAMGAPTLINNLIASNQARIGGAPYGYGGGVYVSNGVVRGNQFISNSASNGGGIATLLNTTFEGNLSRGTKGGNFILETGGVSRLANNFLLETNCPTGMFPGNSAIQVVNNTIVGCFQGIYVPVGASPPISNNLFYSNTTAIAGEGTPLLDYNGFWMNGSDFAVPTSTLTGTHNVFSNPLFVDPAAGDYHLQVGSPMIDRGTSAGAPSTDYDGQTRPAGEGVDIGADEFVPTYATYLPVVLKAFGP
ncbi:MAG TPA: choice-of-anchor Q domain-containing protein [Anaerolineae bacterium]|nr:choice-of-anchor Q domain-containing protein [Anaerolineae bacterium]